MHLLMGAQPGFYPRCWFQTPNWMMFSKRWRVSSSSQTGLSDISYDYESFRCQRQIPISVTVPDFFLLHIQGFMAFKFSSLGPVIFHLHAMLSRARVVEINVIGLLIVSRIWNIGIRLFLNIPCPIWRRMTGKVAKGYPPDRNRVSLFCVRVLFRAVLGQQTCGLSRDLRPSLWSWVYVPRVRHSLLTWFPLTGFPVALPVSSHRVPDLYPISSVTFKYCCWSDLYGLQRDLEKLFNLRAGLQRESKTNILEQKEL